MESVSISDLKMSLSSYLVKVRAGTEVLVTDRGRPVARLVPYHASASDPDRMAALVAEGVLRPARQPVPAEFYECPPPTVGSGTSLLQALLDERAEGR